MGAIIGGAFVVECEAYRHTDGSAYSVNFRAWLECDADELRDRRAAPGNAEPNITGHVKWDGCINWISNPKCMTHGCGPHHADTVRSALREVYRQSHGLLHSPDYEIPQD